MAEVRARPGESIDSLLKRFKKAVENAGILADYRKSESYEKPSIAKKKKKAAAIKRARKAEKTRRPKISKVHWKWNRSRTKKIEIKQQPKEFSRSNDRNKQFGNKPYRSKQNSNYRNKNRDR